MKSPIPKALWPLLWVVAALLVVSVGWLTREDWLPIVRGWASGEPDTELDPSEHEDEHEHGHESPDVLHLSEQARKNIGLEVGTVQLGTYERTSTIPGVIVEQPGRTRLAITAAMTGVVTDLAIRRGETVRSGDVLFRLRLTHEDLIDAQTEFLRNLTQLDVTRRQIARLREITQEGITAGEVVLEREYERDKLLAAVNAAREALLLHGLSEEQVDVIERSRRLVREITVTVPLLHDDHSVHDESESVGGPIRPVTMRTSGVSSQEQSGSPGDRRAAAAPADQAEHSHETRVADFVVLEIAVHRGEAVQAGTPLCVLADMERLYVEGRAFEQDAPQLATAARQGWKISALVQTVQRQPEVVRGLDILYVANEIDPETRALYFYAGLENVPVRDETTPDGRRYVTWRFKPGQRVQLHVPVEAWSDVITLPVNAVAREGAEFYVFVQNGDHFERRPVHVLYRDQLNAVIEHDGSIFPGERVALNAAHQLQMALKNKAGGGGAGAHHGHVH